MAAGPAGGAPLADPLQDAAAKEHALEVRGRDVVAQRGDVDLAELRDRECVGREREAEVRVGELGAQARPRSGDQLVLVRRRRRRPGDAAAGVGPDVPVTEVMTPDPVTGSTEEMAFEVLLEAGPEAAEAIATRGE